MTRVKAMPVERPAMKARRIAKSEGDPQCPGQDKPQKLVAVALAISSPTSDTCDRFEPIHSLRIGVHHMCYRSYMS